MDGQGSKVCTKGAAANQQKRKQVETKNHLLDRICCTQATFPPVLGVGFPKKKALKYFHLTAKSIVQATAAYIAITIIAR